MEKINKWRNRSIFFFYLSDYDLAGNCLTKQHINLWKISGEYSVVKLLDFFVNKNYDWIWMKKYRHDAANEIFFLQFSPEHAIGKVQARYDRPKKRGSEREWFGKKESVATGQIKWKRVALPLSWGDFRIFEFAYCNDFLFIL